MCLCGPCSYSGSVYVHSNRDGRMEENKGSTFTFLHLIMQIELKKFMGPLNEQRHKKGKEKFRGRVWTFLNSRNWSLCNSFWIAEQREHNQPRMTLPEFRKVKWNKEKCRFWNMGERISLSVQSHSPETRLLLTNDTFTSRASQVGLRLFWVCLELFSETRAFPWTQLFFLDGSGNFKYG